HTIPYQTPFLLEGQASDPDGDPVTYCWEEYDLGPSGAPSNPTGNAPLFRSFLPNVSPIRYFPKLAAVVANANSLGEKLPTYARSMQFRLTVRDGKLNGGGVTYEEVLVTLDVVNTGAPFLVTAPNTAVTWIGGTQENVTWDVVGTDVAPISTQNVDIFLSTDGGFTYPVTLATAVPNNGLATVTVPSINTNTARVMVRGAGNVFYDISNANFTITTPQALTEQSFNDAVHFYPNPSAGNFNFSMAGDYRGDLTLTVNDITGKVMVRKYLYKHAAGLFEQFNMEALPAGVYVAELQTEAGFKVEKLVISR
ncbi:MAG: T9SS type A sorting domain-containing protein, partial [Bacteroidia bacterium]|nr:T9SS type A sorting domain-containing protein [Bacteroidia bacterium]